jgi:hypothetical protein
MAGDCEIGHGEAREGAAHNGTMPLAVHPGPGRAPAAERRASWAGCVLPSRGQQRHARLGYCSRPSSQKTRCDHV